MKQKHKEAFMRCAEAFAECSVGVRAKVGAVIVQGNKIISQGYNGLPSGLEGPLENEDGVTRPEVRHAEKNALLWLSCSQESAQGAWMFATASPCEYCAHDIVDAGIKRVYYRRQYRLTAGIDYLLKNGVEVIHMPEGGMKSVRTSL